ncbi:MAG TPA: hypothetical protein VG052_13945 [Puia sp.]|jgi:hypothetical protein|nr:hypothetical protein [Puia sp.]
MSQQETATPPSSPKKKVRKEIGEKLAGALAEYKQELGEKTLATHVRNISKLISRDLLKISKKREKVAKKGTAKKDTAKKVRKTAVKK